MGRILKTHYNSKELAAELIDGGDMSSCWTEDRWNSETKAQEYGPQYYSQRGEDSPPRHDKDLNEYLCNSEEYSYIFTKEGEWVCYTNDDRVPGLVKKVEIPSGALAV